MDKRVKWIAAGATAVGIGVGTALLVTNQPLSVTANQVITGAISGDLNITADSVWVHDAAVSGSLFIGGGTRGVRVERCVFNGPTCRIGTQGTTALCLRPVLIGNKFPHIVQGSTYAGHPLQMWNVESGTFMFNQYDVTVEAGNPSDQAGPVWYFDFLKNAVRSDTIRIHLNRYVYGAWRMRSDTMLNRGSYGNKFDRFAVIVNGAGTTILPSSSADCGNPAKDYTAQCIGAWNNTMDSCLIDAKACASSEIYWQGGMTGWTITNSRLAANGDAIHAIDIHRDTVRTCEVQGSLYWDDAYSRPLPKAGDMVYCQNTTSGGTKTDAAIANVSGWIVTTCGTPPPNPTPSPADTARFTIKSNPPVTFTLNKVPAVVTVVAPTK